MKRANLWGLMGICMCVQSANPVWAEETSQGAAVAGSDPYLWLEEVEGEAALKWVREQNATSSGKLEALPEFNKIRERLLDVYESDERIPYVNKQGEYFYNFWRDRTNTRGVMRRTTLAEYRKAKPAWEVVLDIDALAQREQENWVYNGSNCLYPDYQRCLIYLSRGGGDTFVVREFDTSTKQFVADGFVLPAAKSRIAWRDRDTLFVGTKFGADALTDSGYPRQVKSWKRGTPLTAASLVFEAQQSDMVAFGGVADQPGYHREFVSRQVDFFNRELFLYQSDQLRKLPVPGDAEVQPFGDQALVTLRSAWQTGGKTYEAGSLVAMDWERFVDGKSEFVELFKPSARISLNDITPTRNYVLLTVLDNVASRVYALTRKDGKWLPRQELPTPRFGVVSVSAVDEDNSDEYFMTSSDVVTPASLRLRSAVRDGEELLKQLPKFYKSDGLTITQHEAASKDGTRVPYFQVASKQVKANGSNPTLLYGYGGFQLSSLPSYNSSAGLAWLEQGGVYVIANIRGGGEFGPQWHQAALEANRQRAYDDFIAVAEDLVKRKMTAPKHLGIIGGSNGGLLMGVMLTQRPDLFGAVVCQVPLLDMRRYNKLLAGASWMAEYGDPDQPAEWEFISKYSPYQNVAKGKKYPPVLFTTSTRDDRVHPGHARKMMARMKEQGHDVLLYENVEGGHGGAANSKQQAYLGALAYTFLWQKLR
jgi:prolyl oligopeptidase